MFGALTKKSIRVDGRKSTELSYLTNDSKSLDPIRALACQFLDLLLRSR